jgi:hypothetical protein
MTEILLPADEPRKARRRGVTVEPGPVSAEAVQQTLAEYERLAIGTGEWNGTDAPEFSHDGETWSTAWARDTDGLLVEIDTDEHPVFARATVYRKRVKRPTVVVVRWDESLPADDHWRTLWQRKPVTMFGAFALRAALRRAFRDVIGDQYGPDEQHEPTTDEGTDQ